MAKGRLPDAITIETDLGTFDRFEALEVQNSIDGETAATFSLGDDGAWAELERIIHPGQHFAVYLNKRLRMKGRAEVNEIPGSTDSGCKLSLTVRPKLADARYGSADVSVSVQNVSIKDFVLALFAPYGFTADDFYFAERTAADLMTGKATGYKVAPDLQAIQIQQAKVNPGETTFACAERHLRRHHCQMWDLPDGRIVVGAPDDTQAPKYRFTAKRGAAAVANNVLSYRRIRDWSEVPSEIHVYGQSPGKDIAKATIKAVAVDLDLFRQQQDTGDFNRPVIMVNEQIKTQEWADAQAQREMSLRQRSKDAWTIEVDGWSYWNGTEQIPYATNTTADVDIDCAGGPVGRYLVHAVNLHFSVSGGCTTSLQLVAAGIWVV